MFPSPLFRSSAGDLVELALTALLIVFAIAWRPRIAAAARRLAEHQAWCMLALAIAPVALRLLLLARHPIPVPDVYDEFSHLLVADTLRHFRLANAVHPFHRFFETFFVLQEPSYASIYPIGQGLLLAIGKAVFGHPWAGVVLATAALCSLTYWMLRGWVTPGWALVGGVLAVFEFGPLNPWMNNYWGGALPAAAGCMVFGALPRLRREGFRWPAIVMGLGVGIHAITRPYESIFLLLSMLLYLAPRARWAWKPFAISMMVALPALGITLLQNMKVTDSWSTLPYALSQYEYGVPAALTLMPQAAPHRELTREQELGFRMQSAFQGGPETLARYANRLIYRTRFYRFFFLPALYVAVAVFLSRLREWRAVWLVLTVILFALGVNFFPAWQYHYVAAETCLFVLIAVMGLERLSRVSAEAAHVIVLLCAVHFVFWMFAAEPVKPERRTAVAQAIAAKVGKLLVFVKYGPRHIFQEEWVWNEADIDAARVVWARDLGDEENARLMKYYAGREVWVLEADVRPLPLLEKWVPAPPPPPPPAPEIKPTTKEPEGLHFEPVPQGKF